MTTEYTTITPVGAIISYYGATAPNGYFACDGAEFDAAVYPKLAAVLGENKVPDLRGYFIRGYDTRNEKDPEGAGRELGSEQLDAIRNITGDFLFVVPTNIGDSYIYAGGHGAFSGYDPHQNVVLQNTGAKTVERNGRIQFDASQVVPTAAENRPINVNLLYCIKHDEPETLPVPAKASTAETVSGVNDSKYATPFGIKAAIDHAVSLIKQCVCVKASTDEAMAGTDDTKYVTPAGMAAAIAESACGCPPGGTGGIMNLRLDRETIVPAHFYMGKQVYAKLINFGALPASGLRSFIHEIPNIEWCQVSWDYSTVRKNNDPDLATLGVVSTAPPAYNIHWRVFVNKNSIQAHPLNSINTNTDWSAVICVLYTKTTDEPIA